MIRSTQIAVLTFVCIGLAGCPDRKEPPVWDNTTIDDLAGRNPDGNSTTGTLKTINFDLHAYEIPAEDFPKLSDVRSAMEVTPLKFNNYFIFSENFFSVYYGKSTIQKTINDLLVTAGAFQRASMTILLSEDQIETINIAGLNSTQTIFFTSSRGLREAAQIGPGALGLRIKGEPVAGVADTCNITAYPVFVPPAGSSIPQLQSQRQLREFPFTSVAFGAQMSVGDFIILMPEKYISDMTALSGLFFSNPQGSSFFDVNSTRPPEIKPSVRFYILICTNVGY